MGEEDVVGSWRSLFWGLLGTVWLMILSLLFGCAKKKGDQGFQYPPPPSNADHYGYGRDREAAGFAPLPSQPREDADGAGSSGSQEDQERSNNREGDLMNKTRTSTRTGTEGTMKGYETVDSNMGSESNPSHGHQQYEEVDLLNSASSARRPSTTHEPSRTEDDDVSPRLTRTKGSTMSGTEKSGTKKTRFHAGLDPSGGRPADVNLKSREELVEGTGKLAAKEALRKKGVKGVAIASPVSQQTQKHLEENDEDQCDRDTPAGGGHGMGVGGGGHLPAHNRPPTGIAQQAGGRERAGPVVAVGAKRGGVRAKGGGPKKTRN